MKILYASIDDVAIARVQQFASIAEMFAYVSANQKDYQLSTDALSIMPAKCLLSEDYDMGVFDSQKNTVEQYGFPQLVGYCKITDDISIEDYKRAVIGAFSDDKKYRGAEIRSVADKIQQGESVFKATDAPDPPKRPGANLTRLMDHIIAQAQYMSIPSGENEYSQGFIDGRNTLLRLVEDIFEDISDTTSNSWGSRRWYDQRRSYQSWRDDVDDIRGFTLDDTDY